MASMRIQGVVAMAWFAIENGRIKRHWGARDAASLAAQARGS
jgi:hypothetical protein